MGLFGGEKVSRSAGGRVCPVHGRWNSYTCTSRCMTQINHALGRETKPEDETDRDPVW
jgi:hypothetical protein